MLPIVLLFLFNNFLPKPSHQHKSQRCVSSAEFRVSSRAVSIPPSQSATCGRKEGKEEREWVAGEGLPVSTWLAPYPLTLPYIHCCACNYRMWTNPPNEKAGKKQGREALLSRGIFCVFLSNCSYTELYSRGRNVCRDPKKSCFSVKIM